MKLRFVLFGFWTLVAARAAELGAFDAYVEKAMRDWQCPGVAVAVVQDGRVLFTRGYGVREANQPAPVTEHTLFAIASNTKAFTAAGIAMLVHQKKLNWDDRVQTHLPWFEVFGDAWISRETRLDDLLCHRIGFRTFGGDLLWWNTPYSAEEVVRRARHLKPSFGFRRGHGYSNIAFLAAGEVIARVSGTSYREFTREQIFQPLGMKNTVLSVTELTSRTDVATPHGSEDGKPFVIAWQGWDNCSAAGGIISSAADMAQWLRLQLGEGKLDGRVFWSPRETWRMWSMHNPTAFSPGALDKEPGVSLRGAALGWFVTDYHGELLVNHSGAYDGMFSRVVMVPRKKIAVAVLTNGMTGIQAALSSYAIDRLLGRPERDWSAESLKRDEQSRAKKSAEKAKADQQRLTGTQPSLPLEKYAGRYGGAMYGDATVARENGGLTLRLQPNPELVADLVHWQHDVFEIKWRKKFAWFGNGKAQFLLDANSRAVEFKMDVPNEDFWFDELEFKRK